MSLARRFVAFAVLASAMGVAVAYADRRDAEQDASPAAVLRQAAIAGAPVLATPSQPRRAASSASATPTPRASVATDAHGVPLAVAHAVTASKGDLAVAVYDATTGKTYTYDDSARFMTGSVVKLSILGETLRQQQGGRTLDEDDLEQMAAMIEHSDNNAATYLWREAGRGAAIVGTYDRLVGTTQTTADSGGSFGLTVTNAADQVKVMKAIAYPNAVLSDASRAQALGLLQKVEADQRFGATGGVPAGVEVDVKNGWLPHDVGWYVNTVAHVHGGGRDYVVAIMSRSDATEQTGIDRLEAVSAAVWATAGSGDAG